MNNTHSISLNLLGGAVYSYDLGIVYRWYILVYFLRCSEGATVTHILGMCLGRCMSFGIFNRDIANGEQWDFSWNPSVVSEGKAKVSRLAEKQPIMDGS